MVWDRCIWLWGGSMCFKTVLKPPQHVWSDLGRTWEFTENATFHHNLHDFPNLSPTCTPLKTIESRFWDGEPKSNSKTRWEKTIRRQTFVNLKLGLPPPPYYSLEHRDMHYESFYMIRSLGTWPARRSRHAPGWQIDTFRCQENHFCDDVDGFAGVFGMVWGWLYMVLGTSHML